MTTNTTQHTPDIQALKEAKESAYLAIVDGEIKPEGFVDYVAGYFHSNMIKSQSVEQSQPVKSLQECQQDVSESYSKQSWEVLLKSDNRQPDAVYWEECFNLLRDQFKGKLEKTIIDEDILREFPTNNKSISEIIENKHKQTGAKWMREQLTGKP